MGNQQYTSWKQLFLCCRRLMSTTDGCLSGYRDKATQSPKYLFSFDANLFPMMKFFSVLPFLSFFSSLSCSPLQSFIYTHILHGIMDLGIWIVAWYEINWKCHLHFHQRDCVDWGGMGLGVHDLISAKHHHNPFIQMSLPLWGTQIRKPASHLWDLYDRLEKFLW